MTQIQNKSINKYIDITSEQLIKIVNDKSLNKLGYKMLKSISTTLNYKTRVEFENGKVLNFSCFKLAVEHLNVTYNLRLSQSNKKIVTSGVEYMTTNIPTRSVVINKLETLIKSFLSSQNNFRLNNIMLSDYIESSEWKNNNFDKNDCKEIVSYLERSTGVLSKRYIHFIDKLLNK